MAGFGSPHITAQGTGRRIAIVGAQWYPEVTDQMVDRARAALTDSGVADITVVRVPGTFELPVTCRRLAERFDAMIALGVVVRGGTPHFDYVCEAATMGLTQVAVDTGVPIGFGVLTCDNEQQALDRAGLPDSTEDKGYEAAIAVLATLDAIDAVTA
ncbi:6,7-dimethyl-8-ribityllumazine synthase [Raineyella antarctica]|uniref:6,7-dimethyl-8-ribityllumazine synthase n=1 Tax=Raineyella antarctica TaxID=1577474 RepID=A0A1G6HB03_9ACTN|nr:6,7-dimethyl-8-ribityllumazine synthase [Raineyella antarctica]SDB91115.1 6,7-dimethyl-8-ribityllumazine synthase [Raineyella antarctica]